MNFGQNTLNWLLTQGQALVLVGCIIFAVFFAIKRETNKLVGFLIVAAIALFVVFNPYGFKDLLLMVTNKVFGV